MVTGDLVVVDSNLLASILNQSNSKLFKLIDSLQLISDEVKRWYILVGF